jgi:hypothetical protein
LEWGGRRNGNAVAVTAMVRPFNITYSAKEHN